MGLVGLLNIISGADGRGVNMCDLRENLFNSGSTNFQNDFILVLITLSYFFS